MAVEPAAYRGGEPRSARQPYSDLVPNPDDFHGGLKSSTPAPGSIKQVHAEHQSLHAFIHLIAVVGARKITRARTQVPPERGEA